MSTTNQTLGASSRLGPLAVNSGFHLRLIPRVLKHAISKFPTPTFTLTPTKLLEFAHQIPLG